MFHAPIRICFWVRVVTLFGFWSWIRSVVGVSVTMLAITMRMIHTLIGGTALAFFKTSIRTFGLGETPLALAFGSRLFVHGRCFFLWCNSLNWFSVFVFLRIVFVVSGTSRTRSRSRDEFFFHSLPILTSFRFPLNGFRNQCIFTFRFCSIHSPTVINLNGNSLLFWTFTCVVNIFWTWSLVFIIFKTLLILALCHFTQFLFLVYFLQILEQNSASVVTRFARVQSFTQIARVQIF